MVRAVAGNAALRIVHVLTIPAPFDPYGYLSINPDTLDVSLVGAAKELLEDSREEALSLAPRLQISTSLIFGTTSTGLIREGRAAELIVLGRSSRRRVWFIRTLNAKVARGVRNRLVVVGNDEEYVV